MSSIFLPYSQTDDFDNETTEFYSEIYETRNIVNNLKNALEIISDDSYMSTKGKNTYKSPKDYKKKYKKLKGEKKQNERIKRIEKLVLPAIEVKSKDQVNSTWTVSSSGRANYPMFALAVGAEKNQRVGDKVTILSHQLNMTIAAADNTQALRLMFVVTPSTTALSISDVLEYSNYTTYGDLVFSSPYKRRASTAETSYNVLFDKVYHFEDSLRLITDRAILKCGKYGKEVQFNTSGSDQPENYQLIMLAISDSGSIPDPAVNIVVRTKYIDL